MLNFRPATWPSITPRRWQRKAFDAVVWHFTDAQPAPAMVSAIMGSGKSYLLAELCGALVQQPGEVVVVSTSTELLVESLYRDISSRCKMTKHVGVWYGRSKKMGDIVVSCVPSVPALSRKIREMGRKVTLWIADEAHRTECPTLLKEQELLAPQHSLGVTATPFRASHDTTISLFTKCIYRYGVAEAQVDGVVVPWRIVHAEVGAELDTACIALAEDAQGPGLVNARDIEDAEAFAQMMSQAGIPAEAVHSKRSSSRIRRAIHRLEHGELRCLVHVNLLTEGANYPWLRWLLLRREVESRVRFIQEIGRLLRSHPGKDFATFYDPHDLFGTFRLTYQEALGELPPEEPKAPEVTDPRKAAAEIDAADPAMALAWIESVIRTLVVAADAAGMLEHRPDTEKADRFAPSNDMQQAALKIQMRKAQPFIPDGWAACIQAILSRPEGIRFGFVGDLLAVLAGVVRLKAWPPVDTAGRISAVPNTIPMIVEENGQTAVDVEALGD